uniref:Cytochrome P450 2K1-like n=1 Tax=Callorhinchus milii TaxID=7868 RepID=A0A4W3H233_CALMI
MELNLVMTTRDLFIAGMETTSTTLRWAILLMMKFPEFQQKVHEEIDQVIGTDRHPRLEDRKAMPFTDAVIHETQRFGNIVPLNLPHATTADTNFRGYFIPKVIAIMIIIIIRIAFLTASYGFRKRDAFMPFSAGRRACAGESLAKAELFLFFSTLMQRFRFQPPPGVTDLPLTAIVGITSSPTPYKLCAVLR